MKRSFACWITSARISWRRASYSRHRRKASSPPFKSTRAVDGEVPPIPADLETVDGELVELRVGIVQVLMYI